MFVNKGSHIAIACERSCGKTTDYSVHWETTTTKEQKVDTILSTSAAHVPLHSTVVVTLSAGVVFQKISNTRYRRLLSIAVEVLPNAVDIEIESHPVLTRFSGGICVAHHTTG
jgi:hypothetical protein